MAASLVQPKGRCPQTYVVGLPTTFAGGLAVTSSQWENVLGGDECHNQTFTTAPSMSMPASNGVVLGMGGELVEPRVYPFKHVQYTRASYRRDTLPELGEAHQIQTKVAIPCIPSPFGIIPTPSFTVNAPGVGAKVTNSWALCLPIPMPCGMPDATLESVMYTIRYASYDTGSASVNTELVLARGDKLGEGIVADYCKIPMYAQGGAYGPPMVDETLGTSLFSSVPAFKNTGEGWSQYLDHQRASPNVRVAGDPANNECHCYLFFHVYEYPGAEAQRSLSVDVSATWNDGEELRKAKFDRERELREMKETTEKLAVMKHETQVAIKDLEEKQRVAKAEYEKHKEEQELRRLAFEAAEIKAQEHQAERIKEADEKLKQIAHEEAHARAEHDKRMKALHKATEEAERKIKQAAAPLEADAEMQLQIAEIAAKVGQKCDQGYAWVKQADGYRCKGGGHFVSFTELGMA